MNHQDISRTNTIEQLRQRYDFDSIIKNKKAVEVIRIGITKVENEQENILKSIIINVSDTLESQSDISLWFFNGIPTLENNPVSTWAINDYGEHLSDLYYDQENGHVYKFINDGIYKWIKIDDSNLIQAMSLTNASLDTSDSLRNVFFTTPSPPYSNGDWYVKDNLLYICQVSKLPGDVYNENDFIIAAKYTDNTQANKINDKLVIVAGQVTTIIESLTEIVQTIEDNRYYVDEIGEKRLISSSLSEIKQTVSEISQTVSNSLDFTKENNSSDVIITDESVQSQLINFKLISTQNTNFIYPGVDVYPSEELYAIGLGAGE